MCCMLVDQVHAIALFHHPVGTEDLPDDFVILEKRLLFFCRLYLFRFFIRNNRLQFYRLFLFGFSSSLRYGTAVCAKLSAFGVRFSSSSTLRPPDVGVCGFSAARRSFSLSSLEESRPAIAGAEFL